MDYQYLIEAIYSKEAGSSHPFISPFDIAEFLDDFKKKEIYYDHINLFSPVLAGFTDKAFYHDFDMREFIKLWGSSEAFIYYRNDKYYVLSDEEIGPLQILNSLVHINDMLYIELLDIAEKLLKTTIYNWKNFIERKPDRDILNYSLSNWNYLSYYLVSDQYSPYDCTTDFIDHSEIDPDQEI